MLTKLHIENYALIDELSVDFGNDFTIITGETGAGKSILLGALGLILGNRADVLVLQQNDKKCIVEGEFNIATYGLKGFFKEYELDYLESTFIRREINPQGRSRAFINDTPVTLNQLKELTNSLVDIHSQHETLSLATKEFQYTVLDAFARQTGKVKEYKILFGEYKQLKESLSTLKAKEHTGQSDLDYYQFQYDELEEANLQVDEQESAEQEVETLSNSEEIQTNLSNAVAGLSSDENSITSQLQQVKQLLQQAAKYSSEFKELNERFLSAQIELEDIASELEAKSENIQHDPERLQYLTERINTIYALQKKHHVNSVSELLEVKNRLEEKLSGFSSLENEIEKAEKELQAKKKETLTLAKTIAENRKAVAKKLEQKVTTILANLGMQNATLKIDLQLTEELGYYGINELQFLFSPNKGSEFKLLNKVASGGELSRLMLSIRSVVAELASLPTIIFDEIDTGVSGEIADKVGRTMKAMAKHMQVIAITHLPQIAGKGNAHFLAYKEVREEATFSSLKKLEDEARVDELARMLSGERKTKAALENARELLK